MSSATRQSPPPPGRRSGWSRPLSLGRIGGIPLQLDRSWFVIAALIILLYTPVLVRSVPQIGAWSYAVAAVFCVLLAASVLVHELAHAWAARAFGWPVTHIVLSLMGGHTSFGRARPSWVGSVLVSVLGPLANLLLAGGGLLVLALVGTTPLGTAGQVGLVLVELTTWANLFVGVFNLIPGLPLDGGRALEGLVWGLTRNERTGTLVAAWTGRVVAALVVVWLALSGLWRSLPLVLVALLLVWMLVSGASTGLRRSRAMRVMSAVRARDLMEPAIAVAATTPLATVELLLREAFGTPQEASTGQPRGHGPVGVVGLSDDGAAAGVLNPARITAVPADRRPRLTLGEVMDHLPAGSVLSSELSELALLEVTAEAGLTQFVIVDAHNTPVGILRAARINQVLKDAGLLG